MKFFRSTGLRYDGLKCVVLVDGSAWPCPSLGATCPACSRCTAAPPKTRHGLFLQSACELSDGLRTCATWLSCSSAVGPLDGGVDGRQEACAELKSASRRPPAFCTHPCDHGPLDQSHHEVPLSRLLAMQPCQHPAFNMTQSLITMPSLNMQKSKL